MSVERKIMFEIDIGGTILFLIKIGKYSDFLSSDKIAM